MNKNENQASSKKDRDKKDTTYVTLKQANFFVHVINYR